jgi:hypothetical protein
MKLLKKSDTAVLAKKDQNARIKEKREKIDAIFKGDGLEPTINPLNYKLSLIQAMNWHNIFTIDKTKKLWALSSVADKIQKTALSKLDDEKFRQLGTLIHMKEFGNVLENSELSYINNKMDELIASALIPSEIKTTTKTNVLPIQDKIKTIIEEVTSDIDGEIDSFINNGYPKDYKFKTNLKSLSSQVSKLIPPLYKSHILELEEVLAKTDDDLNDSYSSIKVVSVRRLLQLLNDIVSSCTQQSVLAKKPVTIKAKAPIDLIKSLKYLISFEDLFLNLKSESPVKLINCTSAFLYDTVKRKLTFYTAAQNETLSIKGTTIIGFDIESSGIKSIRNSDAIKDLVSTTKKQAKLRFDSISTKKQVVTGRTNSDMIILKTFN